MKTNLLSFDFKFCSVLIPNRQPESPIWLERAMHAANPLSTPAEVIFGFSLVIVDIVFVADIERRIRKDQINRSFVDLGQKLDAIALMDFVFG